MISIFQEELNVRKSKVTMVAMVSGISAMPALNSGGYAGPKCGAKHKPKDKRGVRLSERYIRKHR